MWDFDRLLSAHCRRADEMGLGRVREGAGGVIPIRGAVTNEHRHRRSLLPYGMSVRLSEILEHDAPHLHISNRKRLLAFYDALVDALKKGELTPGAGALPSSLNALLQLLPGDQTPAKRDRELTDWSVENDLGYAAFLDKWRAQTPGQAPKTAKPRAIAAPLHQAVTQLQALTASGTKKAALTYAIDVFLDTYALSQHALRLPVIERALPKQLPPEISLGEQVTLGNDDKGNYVGLIRRPTGSSEKKEE